MAAFETEFNCNNMYILLPLKKKDYTFAQKKRMYFMWTFLLIIFYYIIFL